MQLTFIRHTSVAVEPGVCYGNSDVAPASSFLSEAASVREKLGDRHFDAVFCSPLSRCRMLASACGHNSPILDDRLKEMNFGEWEMKRYEEIEDPRLQEWYADYLNVAPTGGESSMQQRARLESFLADLKKLSVNQGLATEQNIGIFTHGGIMIHALVLLHGMSYEEAFRRQPPYGAILEATLSNPL